MRIPHHNVSSFDAPKLAGVPRRQNTLPWSSPIITVTSDSRRCNARLVSGYPCDMCVRRRTPLLPCHIFSVPSCDTDNT